jgi:hypothetical protein
VGAAFSCTFFHSTRLEDASTSLLWNPTALWVLLLAAHFFTQYASGRRVYFIALESDSAVGAAFSCTFFLSTRLEDASTIGGQKVASTIDP